MQFYIYGVNLEHCNLSSIRQFDLIFLLCLALQWKGTVIIMKKHSERITEIGHWFRKHKYPLILLLAVALWISIPPLINLMMNTKATFFPDFFGYINAANSNAWINFYGSIIGGTITLIGVAWTIIDQNKKRESDIKDAIKPMLVATACKDESIKKDEFGGKCFGCVLVYKNIGKGILYNPRVFNYEYTINQKVIGSFEIGLSLKNYIDIGSTESNDISIDLDQKALSAICQSLTGGGNTAPLHIILYVGGKDIYGQDIVTRLVYKTGLVFDYDVRLFPLGSNFTSTVLFDKEEIRKVIDNADPRYDMHRL